MFQGNQFQGNQFQRGKGNPSGDVSEVVTPSDSSDFTLIVGTAVSETQSPTDVFVAGKKTVDTLSAAETVSPSEASASTQKKGALHTDGPLLRAGFPIPGTPTGIDTIKVNLQAGECVFVTAQVAGDGNSFTPVNPPTSANLTFSLVGSSNTGATSYTRIWIWSAVANTQLTNEAITWFSSGAGETRGVAWVFDNASPTIGLVTTGNGTSGVPTVNANVSVKGSVVFTLCEINNANYVGAYGHVPTPVSGNTVIDFGNASGGAWHYWVNETSAPSSGTGTVSVGVSDTISEPWAVVAVEILPKGLPQEAEAASLKFSGSVGLPPVFNSTYNNFAYNQGTTGSLSLAVSNVNAPAGALIVAAWDYGDSAGQGPSPTFSDDVGLSWTTAFYTHTGNNNIGMAWAFAPAGLSLDTVRVSWSIGSGTPWSSSLVVDVYTGASGVGGSNTTASGTQFKPFNVTTTISNFKPNSIAAGHWGEWYSSGTDTTPTAYLDTITSSGSNFGSTYGPVGAGTTGITIPNTGSASAEGGYGAIEILGTGEYATPTDTEAVGKLTNNLLSASETVTPNDSVVTSKVIPVTVGGTPIDDGFPLGTSDDTPGGVTSLAVTGVTTAAASLMVVIATSYSGDTSASVSGGGLTWTKRTSNNYGENIWTAPSSGPLTNVTITESWNTASRGTSMVVYSIKNTNGIGTVVDGSTGPSTSITTTQSGSLILWGHGPDVTPQPTSAATGNQFDYQPPLNNADWQRYGRYITQPVAGTYTVGSADGGAARIFAIEIQLIVDAIVPLDASDSTKISGGAGNTYTRDQSDSQTPSDSIDAKLTAVDKISEAQTPSETETAALTLTASLSESIGGSGVIAFDTTAHPGGIALKTLVPIVSASNTVTSPAFATGGPTLLVVGWSHTVNNDGNPSLSVSGGGANMPAAGSWTRLAVTLGAANNGVVAVWYAASPGPISSGATVSITSNAAHSHSLALYALTGTAASPIGQNGGTGSTGASVQTVTSVINAPATGSWIISAGYDWDQATARTFTPAASVVDADQDDGAADRLWVTHYVTPDTSAVTIGSTSPLSTSWAVNAVEILAGAVSGALDAETAGKKTSDTLSAAETVTPSEASDSTKISGGQTKTGDLSESESPTDSIDAKLTITAQLSDSQAPTDVETAGFISPQQLSADETVSPSEAETLGLQLGTIQSDTQASSESVDAKLTSTDKQSDSQTPTDSFDAKLTVAASLSEVQTPSDSVDVGLKIPEALAEVQTQSDSVDAVLKQTSAQSDSESPSDSVTGGLIIPEILSEAESPGESQTATDGLGVVQTDSVSATDAFASILLARSTQSEVQTPDEQSDRTVSTGVNRDLAETESPVDSYNVSANIQTQLSEVQTPSDTETAGLVIPEVLSESETPTDAYDVKLVLGTTQSDSESASDAATAALVISAAVSESESGTDVVAGLPTGSDTQSDSQSPSDAVVAGIKQPVVYSDTVTPNDSIDALRIVGTIQSDSQSPTDSTTANLILTAVQSDVETPTEAEDGQKSGTSNVDYADAPTPTDAYLIGSQKVAAAYVDTQTPNESVDAGVKQTSIESDTQTPSEASVAGKSVNSAQSDSQSPTDVVNAALGLGVQYTDGPSALDANNSTQKLTGVSSDTATPTDSIDTGVKQTSAYSDTATPGESCAASLVRVGVVSDSQTPTDSYAIGSQKVGAAFADGPTPTETEDATQKLTGKQSDVQSPTDSIDAGKKYGSAQSESESPSDSADKSQALVVEESDSATPTDACAAGIVSGRDIEEDQFPDDACDLSSTYVVFQDEVVFPADEVERQQGALFHGFNAGFNEGTNNSFN